MGLPVSVVVTEIVMQQEERAHATCQKTRAFWLRYVDDTFTAVHKEEIDTCHHHHNVLNANTQFIVIVIVIGHSPRGFSGPTG